MNDLRLILLGIGLFIIAAIYLWGTFKQKIQDRAHTRKLTSFEQESIVDVKVMPAYDEVDEVSEETLADIDAFLINPEVPDSDISDFSLSAKTAATEDKSTQPVTDVQIITFLIKAAPGKEFLGINILNAAKAVGLEFGDMNIFHHHGVEDLITDQALFSLANMYEPGYFELEQMESCKTKGLALFMQLPVTVDSIAAFDLMQETAIKLADVLQGEIWSSKHKPIDGKALRAMRDVVAESF